MSDSRTTTRNSERHSTLVPGPGPSSLPSPDKRTGGTVRQQRHGLSLLEVMLALAILGGALAAIGELMRIGARNAEMARDLTTAQLLCESTMAEVQLGFLPMQSVGPVQVNDLQYSQEWLYTITIQPIDQQGLSSVAVRIEQNPAVFSRPVSFAVTRWMIDPSVAGLTDESTSTTGGGGG